MIAKAHEKPFLEDPDQWGPYAVGVARNYFPQIARNEDNFDDAVQNGLLRMIEDGLPRVDPTVKPCVSRAYLGQWVMRGVRDSKGFNASPLSGVWSYYGRGQSRRLTGPCLERVARAFGGRLRDEPAREHYAATSAMDRGNAELREDPVFEAVAAKDDRDYLAELLSHIDDRHREALCLRYMDGLSLRAIARQLGVSAQRVNEMCRKSIVKIQRVVAARRAARA